MPRPPTAHTTRYAPFAHRSRTASSGSTSPAERPLNYTSLVQVQTPRREISSFTDLHAACVLHARERGNRTLLTRTRQWSSPPPIQAMFFRFIKAHNGPMHAISLLRYRFVAAVAH